MYMCVLACVCTCAYMRACLCTFAHLSASEYAFSRDLKWAQGFLARAYDPPETATRIKKGSIDTKRTNYFERGAGWMSPKVACDARHIRHTLLSMQINSRVFRKRKFEFLTIFPVGFRFSERLLAIKLLHSSTLWTVRRRRGAELRYVACMHLFNLWRSLSEKYHPLCCILLDILFADPEVPKWTEAISGATPNHVTYRSGAMW